MVFKSPLTITLPNAIAKINGKPTSRDVHAIKQTCIANSLTFNSAHQWGYLRLTTTQQEYLSLTSEANDFTAPTMPAEPDYATETSAVGVAKLEATYEKNKTLYLHYAAVDQAMQAQILAAVDAEYLAEVKHSVLGFHNVDTRSLINHLMTTYGKITPKDIIENEKRAQQAWHPTTKTIEALWKQAQDAKDFTQNLTRGKLDDDRLIIYLTEILTNTEIVEFQSALTAFGELPTADQTMEKFKKEINKVYKNLPPHLTTISPTSEAPGYHTANATTQQPATRNQRKYCWSCGFNWTHTSAQCSTRTRRPGHHENATLENMMNGSQFLAYDTESRRIQLRNRQRNNNNSSNNNNNNNNISTNNNTSSNA